MRSARLAVLLEFIAPSRGLFAAILVVTLFSSVLEGLTVGAFFPVFQALLGQDGLVKSSGVLGAMVVFTGRLPFGDPVICAAVLLVAVTVLRTGMTFLRDTLVAYGSGRVQHETKNRVLQVYAAAPYQFFLDHQQGSLLHESLIASHRVGALAQKAPQMAAEALKIAAIGGLLILAMPQATLWLIAAALIINAVTHLLSARISYQTGKGRQVENVHQTAIVNEFLTGIRQIMAFGTQSMWLERFRRHSRIFMQLFIKDSVWLGAPRILTEGAAVIVFAGLIIALRLRDPSALTAQLPLMGVFAMAFLQLLPSLTQIGQLRMELAGLQADAEMIHRRLTMLSPRWEGGPLVFERLRDGIELKGVGFTYAGRDRLFQGLNLRFKAGASTAIVGTSGSGKTTIANLLLGFFEPSEGQILVDGQPLGRTALESWRRRIGFVSQDAFLFHGTVAENIAFGRPAPAEVVRQAAAVANAHSFIAALPAGYETVVGERGMKLSGGQQQRICIARAILDNPEILIFDEATSALDAESERLVQEAMEQTSRNRTVIIIAHRFATVRRADSILVLDQGRVVEQGRHEELLQAGGRYAQLAARGGEPVSP